MIVGGGDDRRYRFARVFSVSSLATEEERRLDVSRTE